MQNSVNMSDRVICWVMGGSNPQQLCAALALLQALMRNGVLREVLHRHLRPEAVERDPLLRDVVIFADEIHNIGALSGNLRGFADGTPVRNSWGGDVSQNIPMDPSELFGSFMQRVYKEIDGPGKRKFEAEFRGSVYYGLNESITEFDGIINIHVLNERRDIPNDINARFAEQCNIEQKQFLKVPNWITVIVGRDCFDADTMLTTKDGTAMKISRHVDFQTLDGQERRYIGAVITQEEFATAGTGRAGHYRAYILLSTGNHQSRWCCIDDRLRSIDTKYVR